MKMTRTRPMLVLRLLMTHPLTHVQLGIEIIKTSARPKRGPRNAKDFLLGSVWGESKAVVAERTRRMLLLRVPAMSLGLKSLLAILMTFIVIQIIDLSDALDAK
mmetsp:Transcript_89862/g.140648  ORF Transcript_89862/g.140648 Transcript_89862/m.140648 type:complete len:104 (-) Transcript_89862:46-357(-)